MERLNLNIASDVRKMLKELAHRASLKEAEYARELLTAAIKRAQRRCFWEAAAAAQTPERRERDLAITRALEDIDG